MINIKKILITGGAGFIGTNLIKQLVNRSCQITVLDNLTPQVHGINAKLSEEISPYIRFIRGDVKNYNHCAEALENQDIVIHLAADTATGQSMYEINKCTKSNILGISNIMHYICNSPHKIEKLILASSRAVYGEGKYLCSKCGIVYPQNRDASDLSKQFFEPRCPMCHDFVTKTSTDELTPLNPQSIYGVTKLTQEKYVSVLCTALEIPYFILRFQNVYGEGQSLLNPYTGVLSTFSVRILLNQPIYLFEDGLESRDFVHVKDVVKAIILALECPAPLNEVFNVGSGQSTTLIDVVEMLYRFFNKEHNYKINNNYRIGDIRHNYADINNIQHKLNYSPGISLEKGLLNYTEWILRQQIKNTDYDNSITILKRKGLLKS